MYLVLQPEEHFFYHVENELQSTGIDIFLEIQFASFVFGLTWNPKTSL